MKVKISVVKVLCLKAQYTEKRILSPQLEREQIRVSYPHLSTVLQFLGKRGCCSAWHNNNSDYSLVQKCCSVVWPPCWSFPFGSGPGLSQPRLMQNPCWPSPEQSVLFVGGQVESSASFLCQFLYLLFEQNPNLFLINSQSSRF